MLPIIRPGLVWLMMLRIDIEILRLYLCPPEDDDDVSDTAMNGNPEAIPPAMGVAQAINFQPTGGGKAAITCDFVLIASEVNPLIKVFRDNGIEVTALTATC
jgi:Domain of Unknown Function (DUF1259)